ncbi:membrane protein [Pontibacillus halophilus JSM 076056 = DSM 19796]|uniref:Membrane protein n=1 Tax=Pontibacillus halophilus JSM 076056 = DSM 19796 TaxID=1385510 RepID=A0A0A5GK68_9BACI|nr:membrane protein [Pontibacillus halophilus JSM 076056 = DSM 19796]
MKLAIVFIGMIILSLCVFWLPWQSNVLAEMYPEYTYLRLPLLTGIYMTTIPFFIALYQGFKLLTSINHHRAFSTRSVNSLRTIKHCALGIGGLYVIGFVLLITQDAGNPGILLIGLLVMFFSVVIAVFAAILQQLLKSAIDLKSENELTI